MREDGAAAAIDAPRRRIIKRPRLTRLLDEADARILLLVAPAGYGKTTLAREWISDRKVVWVDATPARADVESFALALRNSLQTYWPDVGAGLEQRLRAGLPKPAQLGEFLASSVPGWDAETWLVIDDYHLLMESAEVEALVDAFLTESKCQALISSRVRPSWATTRRLIYGEIEELGKSVLAMTRDEAGQVLRKAQNKAPGLIALADGWPAVIGLAADISLARLPGEAVENSLYDFFAEELFQAASAQVREGITLLAFAPSVTQGMANHLLNQEAEHALDEGVSFGFLDRASTGTYQMHSLIRDFLRRRYAERSSDPEEALERVASYLLDEEMFDDLYVVARDFPTSRSLKNATDIVLSRLLEDSRLESVRPWLEHANAIRLDSPTLDLATAEMSFREGRYAQSEAAALESAVGLGPESPLVSRALFRAGLAAYHRNRPEAALHHHRAAVETAQTDSDRLQGVWGLLSATFELERDPTNLLAQLESLPKTATSRVRVANAKLSYAYRGGVPVSEALAEAEGVLPILSRVDDPMVRSAFLNLLVGNLGAAGRYDEALKFVEDELRIIRDYGLDFALPHALTLRGVGCTGIRRFVDAQRNLNEVDRLARESGDVFSLRNAELQRVRLHLCKGELELASNLAERLGAMPTKGTQGELLSARVLAAAALGNVQLAEKLVRGAEALTNAVEVRRFIDWSRVVIAFQKNEKAARGAARVAFDEAVSDGCVHPFVCAYRAFPPLLDSSDLAETRYEDLAKTLTLAHDRALATRVGIAVGGRLGELSRRESEVLSLLAEGLSNKTIAERLFISDVTVKAHVRRIFEKLRVHSRTEAALMAAAGLARDREL